MPVTLCHCSHGCLAGATDGPTEGKVLSAEPQVIPSTRFLLRVHHRTESMGRERRLSSRPHEELNYGSGFGESLEDPEGPDAAGQDGSGGWGSGAATEGRVLLTETSGPGGVGWGGAREHRDEVSQASRRPSWRRHVP